MRWLSRANRQSVELLLYVMLAALGFSLVLALAPYQLDDAYVTYRYVRNLIDGHGFVFNVGDEPVEGFSSPAWLALLYLGAFLDSASRLPTISLVLGITCFFLLALVAWRSVDPTIGKGKQRIVTYALLATMPGICYYSATGLEQVLFVSALIYCAYWVGQNRLSVPALIAFFVLPWLRPEAPWVLVAGSLQALYVDERLSLTFRKMVAYGLTLLASYGLLLLVRYSVFGDFLPNTFYAKMPLLQEGLGYVGDLFKTTWGLGILGLGSLGAFLGNRTHRGYWLAGAVWLLAPVLEGGDWMPMFRFALPALALFSLAASGIVRQATTARWPVLVLLLALPVAINVKVVWREAAVNDFTVTSLRIEETFRINWLKTHEVKTVALVDIGQVGYFSDLTVFDMAGLTDKTIGRSQGGHMAKRFSPDYFFEKAPEVVFVRTESLPTNELEMTLRTSPVEAMLISDPRFLARYELLFFTGPVYKRSPLYAVGVFASKDLDLQRMIRDLPLTDQNGIPLLLFREVP